MYGYATRVYALPDRKLGVAIVANVDASNPVVDRIGNYALSLLLAEKDGNPFPDAAQTEPLDPARRVSPMVIMSNASSSTPSG